MRSPQSFAAIARQILALLGVIFGVLTQSVTTMHLPVAVSATLAVGGSLILAVEHYVADPSTGAQTSVSVPSNRQVSGAAGQTSSATMATGAAPVVPHAGASS